MYKLKKSIIFAYRYNENIIIPDICSECWGFLILIIMITKDFLFSNGDEVREKVTGFKGTITGTAFYLTGCNTYLVTAKPKDEFSEPTAIWYDEGRLELVKKDVFTSEDVKAVDNGCDKMPNIGRKGN